MLHLVDPASGTIRVLCEPQILGGKSFVLPARGLQARGAWTGLRLYFTPGSL